MTIEVVVPQFLDYKKLLAQLKEKDKCCIHCGKPIKASKRGTWKCKHCGTERVI